VIGNRADAALVATIRTTFQSVRARWLSRASTAEAPLSEDEATDAATAAVIAFGCEATTLMVTAAEAQQDGSWIVYIEALDLRTQQREALRARIPPGDPAHATRPDRPRKIAPNS